MIKDKGAFHTRLCHGKQGCEPRFLTADELTHRYALCWLPARFKIAVAFSLKNGMCSWAIEQMKSCNFWLNLERIVSSEGCQEERDRPRTILLMCMR